MTKPTFPKLTLNDLRAALRAGAKDMMRAPAFGIFFASIYAALGLALTAFDAGLFAWTLVLSLGFPLIAPFAAVGLYEVSRRLETGEPLRWSAVIGRVWAERGGQLPWLGAILMMIFLFWSFFAHMSFALFLGLSPAGQSHTDLMTSTPGLLLIAFQIISGGLVALLTFGLTAVSLPYLLDRDVDFVTAMLTSLKVTAGSGRVFLCWAGLIAAGLLLSMIPAFLGLLITLPLFGHTTWHIYRRALQFDGG